MEIGAVSIKGKVREKDEDSVLALSSTFLNEGREEHCAVCIVADGMGGGELGEVASRIAVNTLRTELLRLMVDERLNLEETGRVITGAIRRANKDILTYSREHSISWMGTTVTIAFILGSTAMIGNVGDSRTYVFDSRGGMKFKTRDHSYVQELVDSGQIAEEDARDDPRRNRITMALGIEEEIKPDINEIQIDGGDSVLLCCDGLWEAYSDDELGKLASNKLPLQELAEYIADSANSRDGSDNISLILARA